MDDVILNKAAIVERCVQRVREEYADDPKNLTDNITRQDSIVLNIQRACEASIDLAMHLVRVHRLGIPQESRDAFEFLCAAKLLPRPVTDTLKRMVGFRNVAVHDYRKLSLPIVQAIIEKHLSELLQFCKSAIQQDDESPPTV
ncbi:MAG: type VII toxin-antitoxin system HepT family RNase toxin [Myxococcaceae bacterium]